MAAERRPRSRWVGARNALRRVGGQQHALAVHGGRTGSGITAELCPLAFPQSHQHHFPHALLLPPPPVVVDRLPGRQFMRQQSPGAPGPPPVHQCVQDLPSCVFCRPSTGLTPGTSGQKIAHSASGRSVE